MGENFAFLPCVDFPLASAEYQDFLSLFGEERKLGIVVAVAVVVVALAVSVVVVAVAPIAFAVVVPVV